MDVKAVKKQSAGRRIDSLQALRALAFLGIFFSHTPFVIEWSALGVSVFFVLSGFLLMNRYGDEELDRSAKGCIHFSLTRIRKLYPLHIITMLLAARLYLMQTGIYKAALVRVIKSMALNVLLIQTWWPHPDDFPRLNGVAWYLSVTMFLYFIFPHLQFFIKKSRTGRLWALCVILFFAEIVSCALAARLAGADSIVYGWFHYQFPVFRIGDFFAGCLLQRVCIGDKEEEGGKMRYSVYECAALVITVVICHWMAAEHENIRIKAMLNRTTMNIPPAALWVYLFKEKRGLITRMCTNRLLIGIGNLSAYAFLIHFVVTKYADNYISVYGWDVSGAAGIGITMIELAASIALSAGYGRIHEWFVKRFA